MKVPVVLPQITLTMADALLVSWLVEPGMRVEEGQPLAEVETDKAIVDVPAPRAGVVAELVAQPGQRVNVEETIAYFEAEDTVGDSRPDVGREQSARQIVTPAALPMNEPAVEEQRPRRRVSPVASRLASQHGIDLTSLTGTGTGGLIVEADVRKIIEANQASKTLPMVEPSSAIDDEEVVPMAPLRRRIAERMHLSTSTTARVTTVADVDMGQVKALRQTVQVTYTVFVVRAAALAIREFPQINTELRGDNIILKKGIHIGVAISIDDALVVPIVRNADHKPLEQIAAEVEGLTLAAKGGTLRPEQMTGGSFTVTNSGVFGSLLFTPIINYPQAATLGMAKVMDTPVVRNGGIHIAPVMNLCLSYDHRILDGAYAVRFLQAVKRILEDPASLMRTD